MSGTLGQPRRCNPVPAAPRDNQASLSLRAKSPFAPRKQRPARVPFVAQQEGQVRRTEFIPFQRIEIRVTEGGGGGFVLLAEEREDRLTQADVRGGVLPGMIGGWRALTALTPCPSPEYGRGELAALTPGPSPEYGRGELAARDRLRRPTPALPLLLFWLVRF